MTFAWNGTMRRAGLTLWLAIVAPQYAGAQTASLTETFGPQFAALFDDPVVAQNEWQEHGGALLAEMEGRGLYLPALDSFASEALARIEEVRQAHPDASIEALSFAALDGMFPQTERSADRSVSIVVRPSDGAPRDFYPFGPSAPLAEAGADTLSERDISFGQIEISGVPVYQLPRLVNGTTRNADNVRYSNIEAQAIAHNGPLILDLRGNTGGLVDRIQQLSAAMGVSSTDLFRIAAVQSEDEQVFPALAPSNRFGQPLLVIVDDQTNSGALIVAHLLSEQDNVTLAG